MGLLEIENRVPNGDQLAESVLISRAKEGDPQAFGQLYLRYREQVYRRCLFYVKSEELAEDLTQETFLKAWEAIPSYRPQKPIIMWLNTIAKNTTINVYRRNGGDNGRRNLNNLDLDSFPDSQCSEPIEVLEQKEFYRVFRQALNQLPKTQQQVVIYRLNGMEYKEIARIVNKTVNAVRVTTHRGLTQLRSVLGETEL